MVIALIISVCVAIIFCALFFDERGSTLDYLREIKSQKEKIQSLEEETHRYSQFERGGKKDLEELDADLICDAVKINGYVPEKKKDSVTFMIQGERYSIITERLPFILLLKQFGIDKDEQDVETMRQASQEVTRECMFGKATVSDDGDMLSFYVSGLEHQYCHFRDVLVEEINIVNDLENRFGEIYYRILKERGEQKQPEAGDIRIGEPKPGSVKIVS